MQVPGAAHRDRPWRIHAIAGDFELEDVWAFRMPGAGADDFPVVLDALRRRGGLDSNAPLVKLLFAIRWRLGAVLGWDDPDGGLSVRVPSLRHRLPRELRNDDLAGTHLSNAPMVVLYELPDEAAYEMANRTVHGVCHLGWVPTREGVHELRMAVLVKPNGLLGRGYLKAIAPFRHLIVYPALTRQWERAWRDEFQSTRA